MDHLVFSRGLDALEALEVAADLGFEAAAAGPALADGSTEMP